MPAVTRRAFLAGPAIGAAAALVAPAEAATPPAKMQGPGVYRYRLGSYQITALYDGTWFLPIDDDFVRNADRAEVNAALGRAFLPPNVLPVSFTALLVNTGKKLVLIDTGTAGQVADTAGVMLDNLNAAGVKPADVDTILISHFHPDHIDGIKSKDNAKVFPNAEILVPEGEWAFWMDDANMARADAKSPVHRYFLNARRIFGDIAKEVQAVQAGHASRARHRSGRRFRPHARPHRLRHSFRRAIDAGDERHGARALAVRAPSRLAAALRHGRAAGGEDAHAHARARGRRAHAGRGLSLPLPGLRPHRQRRPRLRAGARDVGAAVNTEGDHWISSAARAAR